jgi:DNA repair exonuclease SbcCD nuclease subunit
VNHTFRFVHSADLHLDSPLLGLEAFDDAPIVTIREATREALKRLVDLCIDQDVQFLLIAGDIYDGDWKSLATGRFFADQMARLDKAKIPVFLIKGNHDAASLITRDLVVPGSTTFDHKKPETKLIESLKVAIHGQSYKDREVTENLAEKYPDGLDGYFNIGMLHTCGTGGTSLHALYAPCTIEQLLQKGYDYWALGHVHQRDILRERPPIVFPGNIQGRHVRETAPDGKGVTVVEVIDGEVESLTHVPLDTVRWMNLNIDVSGLDTIEDVYFRVATEVRLAADQCGGRLLAVRLTLTGDCQASISIHRDQTSFDSGLRSYVQGTIADVWIEEIRVHVRSEATAPVLADQGSLSDLLEFIRTAADSGRLTEVEKRLNSLRERVKTAAPELIGEIGLDDENLLRSLLPDIEETVLAFALGGGK